MNCQEVSLQKDFILVIYSIMVVFQDSLADGILFMDIELDSFIIISQQMSDFLQQFRQEHIPEYMEMAIESYKANNPEFKLKLVDVESFRQSTQKTIRLFIKAEEVVNSKLETSIMFNNAVFEDGKMIAAGFACQLHYFLTELKGKVSDALMDELLTVDLSAVKYGSTVVTMKAVVHKDFMKMGIAERCAFEKSVHLVEKGYTYEYALILNPFSLRVLKRMGAVVWKDLSFEFNGSTLTKLIIYRDMRMIANLAKPSPSL